MASSSSAPREAPLTGADDPELFAPIHFALNDSLAPKVRKQLAKLLKLRGGTEVIWSDASPLVASELTHLITDTLQCSAYARLRPNGEQAPYPRGKSPADRVEIVTPFWVTKSYDLQALQQPLYYSADKAQFLSGFVFCTSELPNTDALAIESGGRSLGAQFRKELTREVTHLFVVAPGGAKYEAAIQHGPHIGMTVLLPHWFDECVRLSQLVPTTPFEFPYPQYLYPDLYTDPTKTPEERLAELTAKSHPGAPSSSLPTQSKAGRKDQNETMTFQILGSATRAAVAAKEKEAYCRTSSVSLHRAPIAAPNPAAPPPTTTSQKEGREPELVLCTEPIFERRRVYLAGDLDLREGLEAAVKSRIQAAGGTCWSWKLDGEMDREDRVAGFEGRGSSVARADQWERRRVAEAELSKADLVVCRLRQGWEFWTAYNQKKTLGNLSWVYHVLAAARLSSPLERLMHYPLPPAPVKDFVGLRITISNYSGPAREYVRTLIETLGAKFEGAMSKSTDYVITASNFGAKVKHALQWQIPLVTHLWLEACVLEWALLNPILAPEYQASFLGPSVNFTSILGETALRPGAIDKWAALPDSVKSKEEALKRGPRDELMNCLLLPGEKPKSGAVGGSGRGEASMMVKQQQTMLEEQEEEEVVMEVDHAGSNFGEADEVDGEDHAMDVEAEEEGEGQQEEEAEEPARKSTTANGKGKGKAPMPHDESDEEEGSDAALPVKKGTGNGTGVFIKRKGPPPSPGPPSVPAVASTSTSALPKSKDTAPSSPAAKKSSKKSSSKPPRSNSGDSSDDDDATRRPTSKARPATTKGRADSESTLSSARSSPQVSKNGHATSKASTKKQQAQSADEDDDDDEDEDEEAKPPVATTSKARNGTTPRDKGKKKRRDDSDSESSSDHPHTPSKFIDFYNEIPVVGKRAAAGVAAARLKEQMPDVIKFAKELKGSTGKKRKRDSQIRQRTEEPDEDDAEEEEGNLSSADEGSVKAKGKGKAVSTAGPSKNKGVKRKKKDESDLSEREIEVVAPAPKKKSKQVAAVVASASGAVSSFDNPPHAGPIKKQPIQIRILSTGLDLTPQSPEVKGMIKLGAKWLDSANGVTHLVVQNISRTEKFLSAISNAPKVVTRKWMTDSVKQGKFLDEKKYYLKDATKERELGHTLEQIIGRAEEGKLFDQKTIYLTENILPNINTLRNVLLSAGATIMTVDIKEPATMQTIAQSDDVYVVSCPKDRPKWVKLSSKYHKPIYSVEAIFQSVLIQMLNFRDDFRLDLQLEK